MPTAALIVGDEEVRLYGDGPALRSLAMSNGGRWDAERECWSVPVVALRDLTDGLDRAGYTWVSERSDLPRHWAQWLFAELPAEIHVAVREVLHGVLDEHPLHLALLEDAWRQSRRDTDGTAGDRD